MLMILHTQHSTANLYFQEKYIHIKNPIEIYSYARIVTNIFHLYLDIILVPFTHFVATLTWPNVGVKPNTWKSWGFGVLWDS